MSDAQNPGPFIVLTAILDGSARPAAVTRSHGDAVERAYGALGAETTAGLDIIELPVAPPAFGALRETTGGGSDLVAVYDLFPLSPTLDPKVRTIAGQFLAAEVLWALEERGLLKGVPLNLRLDVPKGWDRDPIKVHEKLVAAGALDLSAEAIEAFKRIKARWDAAGATG